MFVDVQLNEAVVVPVMNEKRAKDKVPHVRSVLTAWINSLTKLKFAVALRVGGAEEIANVFYDFQ